MIKITNLEKNFRIHQARSGLGGAFRDLFQREYRTVHAVDSLTFEVEAGEMFALIGENGAGKSTTIKMLTGILTPSAGEIEINGFDPHKQREKYVQSIGVVFGQRSQLWWDLSPLESFRLLRRVYHIEDEAGLKWQERLIEELDLGSFIQQPVRKLSLGQRMRCEVAAALMHKPKLLFLDEPTVGLDVLVKQKIRDFLKSLNETEQTTVLLTTHDVSDIEALCKRVLVMDSGKLIFDGQLDELKQRWGSKTEVVFQFKRKIGKEELAVSLSPFECEINPVSEYALAVLFTHDKLPLVLSAVMGSFEVTDVAIAETSTEQIVRNIYSTTSETNGVASHG
ncbi:ABC transporter ATP-binding protein [Brevibacillus daliensis]|uniref:ABC transporter ATP-binding protein n=1 Tax=Brevibacillus daliensis TaxID=2892995 RepID=UPI001E3EB51A|nr:ATP-binding cassette domain-containing protein [Brevibacillus daliensis]